MALKGPGPGQIGPGLDVPLALDQGEFAVDGAEGHRLRIPHNLRPPTGPKGLLIFQRPALSPPEKGLDRWFEMVSEDWLVATISQNCDVASGIRRASAEGHNTPHQGNCEVGSPAKSLRARQCHRQEWC